MIINSLLPIFQLSPLKIISVFLMALLLVACEPSEEARRKKQLQHEDNIIAGDTFPQYDYKRYSIAKKHGLFFIVPHAYAGGNGEMAFYWPSKTPMAGRSDGKPYPEQKLMYHDKAIEIFLRPDRTGISGEPSMFEEAGRKGWIRERKTIRKGLDMISLTDQAGPIKKQTTQYLATEMKWPDGRTPVVECSDSLRIGGGWMPWKPGVFLSIRFKHDKCTDWPEIYSEIQKVMSQVREIK